MVGFVELEEAFGDYLTFSTDIVKGGSTFHGWGNEKNGYGAQTEDWSGGCVTGKLKAMIGFSNSGIWLESPLLPPSDPFKIRKDRPLEVKVKRGKLQSGFDFGRSESHSRGLENWRKSSFGRSGGDVFKFCRGQGTLPHGANEYDAGN